jgi:patatin-related protein
MCEVRFAIVMYGGVSLAIYINGVTQELFRLVRATAPGADRTTLHFSDAELKGSEAIYREVGRRLRPDGSWRSGDIDADASAVQSRFVVDILSGTSAGGINGIFLAKALANGQDIDALRDLWVEEGDIELLFNQPRAYKGLPEGVKFQQPPSSLLAGQRLYVKARAALRAMGNTRTAGAPVYAEQVDLAVTTTDLQGLELPIQLTDAAVKEPRHKNVLRFVYATEDATGDERNDFADNDDLLAFAARATSSFPFAFQPVILRDVDEAAPGGVDRIVESGERYFGDYVREDASYERFAFADGGYLDNKPFTGATDALRRRRADLPVIRKLLYIEPDPARPPTTDPREAQPRPDALSNVAAALVGLPRTESIREDIAALTQRNGAIERVLRVTREVELAAIAPGGQIEAPPAIKLAYRRLRRLTVIDDLTLLVSRVLGFWPDGDRTKAVRLLLDAWEPDEGDKLTAFVEDYDLRYRLRRIEMLQERIDVLLAGGRPAAALLAAAGSELTAEQACGAGAAWLLARKHGLNEAFVKLRRAGRVARSRGSSAVPEIQAAADGLRLDGTDLDSVVDADDPFARAGEMLAERHTALELFHAALHAHLGPASVQAELAVDAELTSSDGAHATGLSQVLVASWNCSEAIDMVVLPLTYPDLGEVNPVEIFRVSPYDAQSLVPAFVGGKSRLAGAAVGHFGGFLDQSWRRSDLTWGRLDGAERLLTALVPDSTKREALRVRAQAAILREELDEDRTGAIEGLLDEAGRQRLPGVLASRNDADLLQLFSERYGGTHALQPGQTLKLAGRAIAITGDVLRGVSGERPLLSTPMFWVARIGRLLWGFAELAVPSGLRVHGLQRYWMQLALIVGLTLIVLGVIAGVDGAQSSGWIVIGAVAVITVAGWLLQGLMKTPILMIAAVAAFVVLALASAEALRHLGGDIETLWDAVSPVRDVVESVWEWVRSL